MCWVFCSPQSGVKGNVVIADFEVLACSDNVCFPPDPVDDQPVADSFPTSVDCLVREPFKQMPDMGVSFVPVPPSLFLLFKRQVRF